MFGEWFISLIIHFSLAVCAISIVTVVSLLIRDIKRNEVW